MNIKNKEEMNETTQPEEMTVASQTETGALADLPVENDEQVKGGPGGFGGFSVNHNETTAADEEDETEALADLPVENDEQVKGGPGMGGFTLNHNETTVEDEATEESELNDLAVDCEAEAEVKGGKATFKEFTVTKKTD